MKKRMWLKEADELAAAFVAEARARGFQKIEVCGSVRRRELEVGDLDVVVEGNLAGLLGMGFYQEGGSERVTLLFRGAQVNVFRSVPEEWGAMLFYATGPKGSQIHWRAKAKRLGRVLNQHGLFDETGKRLAGETEEGIYAAFGKPWKPPERRGK